MNGNEILFTGNFIKSDTSLSYRTAGDLAQSTGNAYLGRPVLTDNDASLCGTLHFFNLSSRSNIPVTDILFKRSCSFEHRSKISSRTNIPATYIRIKSCFIFE